MLVGIYGILLVPSLNKNFIKMKVVKVELVETESILILGIKINII